MTQRAVNLSEWECSDGDEAFLAMLDERGVLAEAEGIWNGTIDPGPAIPIDEVLARCRAIIDGRCD